MNVLAKRGGLNSPVQPANPIFLLAFALGRGHLPRQRGLEVLLELVDVSFIALGVNKRIRISWPSFLQLFVLRGHAIERRMGAEENLDWERAGLLVCSPEVVDDLRVVRVSNELDGLCV